ncbi:protein kinase domain-containing protein [Sorangium sp. So ce1000]|uniref:serine/threonine-protein kinase n=1 Tax=Sorangium sp. So ce1000 TaxID=3133325 RepID=UPI003F61CCE5
MAQQPAVPSGVPVPGDVLAGKYRIERVLGAGGMGVVFAAWHLVLERRVAVKFLLPEAAALPDAGARFLREARAAAALDGQHIARVLDVGTLDTGAAYMVLEYLTGDDLGQVLQTRGPLPLADAADYLQACEAIAEAHARGIIHRDLKPKNLFLTRRPDGTPLLKVLDFGLSKFIATGDSLKEASLTATGLIMGSIHYMSPEQIRSLKYADVRTDIWALGVILYRMLTGRHPFEGDSVTAVTAAIMMDTPVSILTLRQDVPPAVAALVSRCLVKDPAARAQSVTEIARVLAPFGTQRARLSFESIDRLLPEPAHRGGSSPAEGAPTASTRPFGPPSPSGAGPRAAPDATTAPMPAPPGMPSSPGSEAPGAMHATGSDAPGAVHATLPHASWGNTTRSRAPRGRAALLASAAGALVLVGGLVLAWRLTASRPADDSPSAPSVTVTAPAPFDAATAAAVTTAARAADTATAAPPAGAEAPAARPAETATAAPPAGAPAIASPSARAPAKPAAPPTAPAREKPAGSAAPPKPPPPATSAPRNAGSDRRIFD